MEFKDELAEILGKMELSDAEIQLERGSEGRVGGYIISKSFEGKSQIERQNMIWAFLEDVLPKDKQLQIISLLTLTPDEAGLAA